MTALLSSPVCAEPARVLLMLSDGSAPYETFDKAVRQELSGAAQLATLTVSGSRSDAAPPADLIVAVGMKAAETALGYTDTPVLAAMVPKAGYEALLGRLSTRQRLKPVSAIYINQPWTRQVDFIRILLSRHTKVGVLHSPGVFQHDLDEIRRAAVAGGLALHAYPVGSPEALFATLNTLLAEDDVLLAIPDSAIYNSGNVRNILLSSYRARVPLIGLSQAYVTAGALGAVYSSPEQAARQSAAVIRSFALNGRLPAAQYPEDFSIALNQQVGRSLGIELASPEEIRSRMLGGGR